MVRSTRPRQERHRSEPLRRIGSVDGALTEDAVAHQTIAGAAVTGLTARAGLRLRGKSHHHGSLLVLLA
ncbi:hypothetical protein ASE16_13725 [Leifsonia sp. Root227]|nr:hypothetical protein ASE16_13725 [Leifsonia sp. Root227]